MRIQLQAIVSVNKPTIYVKRLTASEVKARRNAARHALSEQRLTLADRAREVLYSGSKAGMAEAMNSLNQTTLKERFGDYHRIVPQYDPVDKMYHLYVI